MNESSGKVIDVTCALIVDDQNRLFAAQRSNVMSLPMKWELPGGKIEPGETSESCLIREITEELDVAIEIISALEPYTHTYPSKTIRLIPFIVKQVSGQIKLKEHANLKWLNANELLDLDWADADVPILDQYMNYLNAL
jgi:8-oxo-dGTP diphosphatase